MKKDAYYFPHDSNSRNDEKILGVRMKHGWEGYGLYWAIIEKLRESSKYMCVKDYNLIAFDLRVDAAKVKSIIEDFRLFAFTEDGECFYSESLCERMKHLDSKRDSASKAGKISAEKRASFNERSTTVEQALNDRSTIKVNESKVKESKVEESKVTDTPPQEITLKVSTPKKREKQQPDALQLPFVSQNFSSAWEKLVEMPKWRKKLPVSLQMALNSLGKYSEEFAISLIERAIEGGYQGVVFNDTDQAYERWRKTASSVQTNSRLGHNVEVYGSVKDLIAKKYE